MLFVVYNVGSIANVFCVCIYVFMCVCMHVCMYKANGIVWVHACVYVCERVCMYVYTCVLILIDCNVNLVSGDVCARV